MTERVLDDRTYRVLVGNLPCGVVVHGVDSKVVYANQMFATMLGYSMQEALELSAREVIHPDDLPQRNKDAAGLLKGGEEQLRTVRRLLTKDGRIIHAQVRKAAATVDGQRVVMVIIEDWTADLAERESLLAAARTDPLTQVANRRGLRAYLAGRPAERESVLALIDVDGLKRINDVFGHPAGDEVLVMVTRALQALSGQGWFVGRTGGDEFIVDTPDASRSPATVQELIEAYCAGEFNTPAGTEPFTVTVGTAAWEAGADFQEVVAHADAQMYAQRASRAGVPAQAHPEGYEGRHVRRG